MLSDTTDDLDRAPASKIIESQARERPVETSIRDGGAESSEPRGRTPD
jgi:hypothetical protein